MTVKGKNYKVVFRRGRPLTKVLLIVAIVLCSVALITISIAIGNEKLRLELGKAAAATQQRENQDLHSKIDQLGSQQSIEDIAGEELDLHDPNKIIVETE